MNKDITPTNAKGQPHGYWEVYHWGGNLIYKCVYINGEENGFEEWYWDNDGKGKGKGKVKIKNYHL